MIPAPAAIHCGLRKIVCGIYIVWTSLHGQLPVVVDVTRGAPAEQLPPPSDSVAFVLVACAPISCSFPISWLPAALGVFDPAAARLARTLCGPSTLPSALPPRPLPTVRLFISPFDDGRLSPRPRGARRAYAGLPRARPRDEHLWWCAGAVVFTPTPYGGDRRRDGSAPPRGRVGNAGTPRRPPHPPFPPPHRLCRCCRGRYGGHGRGGAPAGGSRATRVWPGGPAGRPRAAVGAHRATSGGGADCR